MAKRASIIDYPREGLDKSIWNTEDKELDLQPDIRADIGDIVYSFLDDMDLPESAVLSVLLPSAFLRFS